MWKFWEKASQIAATLGWSIYLTYILLKELQLI